jgi:hypothetical protein
MNLRRENFGEDVVLTEFDLQPSDGPTRRVAVRVGKPYEVSAHEWACPVELCGHDSRYPDIRGGNALQALCLAISLVRSRLEAFIEKGGKVLNVEDGSECGLRELATTFGGVPPGGDDAG